MNIQGLISVLVGIIGFITFTYLFLESKVGTFGYSSLLALLAIVCIVIPVLSRLKELDLKNLKLTLDKIEETKKDIYAKEKSLKEASHVLAELIAANSAITGVVGDEESYAYSKSIIMDKLKKLAKQLNFSKEEMDKILKYENALAEVHAASKEEHEQKWNDFKNLLKAEAEKNA